MNTQHSSPAPTLEIVTNLASKAPEPNTEASLARLGRWGYCLVASCFFSICVATFGSVHAQDIGDNNNLGVTVQLPTLGVSIDANGILTTRVFPDKGNHLKHARLAAARKNIPQQLQKRSALRKVSLRRLEHALGQCLDSGKPTSEEIECMAGLTGIEYVFVMPDENDIVVAGPAEPWVENLAGRKVGIFSGKPIMLLEDWMAAIRTFAPGRNLNSWVACSIDPSAQGLSNLKSFQQNLPKQVPVNARQEAAEVFAEQLRESLGLASVKVYGIDPRTHAAHVMIEADYRMKLIAVGLELPPIDMKTFIGVLKGAPKQLQSWWLTPNYQCLRQSDDSLSVQRIGRGVKLQTGNISFGRQAKAKKLKLKPSRAARTYASSFTENYVELSSSLPVFAQLRNVVDSLILAAWILKTDGYESARWKPTLLLDDDKVSIWKNPKINHAQCVANAVWKNQVLLLPAGGGVSITAAEAFGDDQLANDSDGHVVDVANSVSIPGSDAWWWD